jgi:hypothetical protein
MPAIVILISGHPDLLAAYIAAIVQKFVVPLLAISARFDASIGDFAPVTVAMFTRLTTTAGISGRMWAVSLASPSSGLAS